MSDANEERLLSSLLREVAEADASMKVRGDLEEQVLSQFERSRAVAATWSTTRVTLAFAVAAAVLLIVAASTRFRSAPGAITPSRPADAAITGLPSDPIAESVKDSKAPDPVVSRVQTSRRRQPARPNRLVVDFVPLMPMTSDELSGSFQIVRGQVPRAALGALAAAAGVNRGDDPVEADVLLGEDGMARAIRVSTDGSVHWRSR
jgi:hypothetical protein